MMKDHCSAAWKPLTHRVHYAFLNGLGTCRHWNSDATLGTLVLSLRCSSYGVYSRNSRGHEAHGERSTDQVSTCIISNGIVQGIPKDGCSDENRKKSPHIQRAQASKCASSKQ